MVTATRPLRICQSGIGGTWTRWWYVRVVHEHVCTVCLCVLVNICETKNVNIESIPPAVSLRLQAPSYIFPIYLSIYRAIHLPGCVFI